MPRISVLQVLIKASSVVGSGRDDRHDLDEQRRVTKAGALGGPGKQVIRVDPIRVDLLEVWIILEVLQVHGHRQQAAGGVVLLSADTPLLQYSTGLVRFGQSLFLIRIIKMLYVLAHRDLLNERYKSY